MIEFGGVMYYIDFKALDKFITVHDGIKNKTVKETETIQYLNENGIVVKSEVHEKQYPQGKEIDAAKYDLVKTFIEYVIDYESDADDALGAERALAQSPLGYKIVFNTLLKEGILTEKEN